MRLVVQGLIMATIVMCSASSGYAGALGKDNAQSILLGAAFFQIFMFWFVSDRRW